MLREALCSHYKGKMIQTLTAPYVGLLLLCRLSAKQRKQHILVCCLFCCVSVCLVGMHQAVCSILLL